MFYGSVGLGDYTARFRFPKHMRTTASQYLVYFPRFLADLGYSVDMHLTEQEGRIFLRIVPMDRKCGREQVYEQLSVFLCSVQVLHMPKYITMSLNVAGRQWLNALGHFACQVRVWSPLLEIGFNRSCSLNLMDYHEGDNVGIKPGHRVLEVGGVKRIVIMDSKFEEEQAVKVLLSLRRR